MSDSVQKTVQGVEETGRSDGGTADFAIHQPGREEIPKCIGRYRIERLLGMGGFGMVFLARDDQLDRPVAIKIPHARRLSRAEDAAPYLSEARMVARLDHPHIVPVFDAGSTPEFPCFVVSKYVEGTSLSDRLRHFRYPWVDAVELVVKVAEALHYAHKQGLVHRDVKPGNILIDTQGQPFVVDFGLALRDQDVDGNASQAGTPAYMSPEQARGEGHRVDGRSDIFSLGVVLYELLAGRRPFHGSTRDALLAQITSHDPKPPRQIADSIPKALERVCLRALAKRATDRYTTALDFADDLRHALSDASQAGTAHDSGMLPAREATFLDSAAPVPGSISGPALLSASHVLQIVPKGLRSFDEHDADFFLELLPGPRDRNGLPDSIRFWKTRIEESDPESTFTVGLIYGPSGCGKSSLVKAGILPRLGEEVVPVYVEATPDETELRLLKSLRKHCPRLQGDLSLKQTVAALRRGAGDSAGKKVLLVLDQFEQWLHTRFGDTGAELVEALRQCDGEQVQCLVLVRDDFYVAVNRFFQQLEVPILEGHNYALVDLFDLDHARKVLTAFGRAYGRLPDSTAALTAEQQSFLTQAVAGLAQEDKVISVRLALFAEMMKGRTWTAESLRDVGGTEGVGVTFLEETFSAHTAPPTHRLHQHAARAVLKALLPGAGTDIKGQMQPYEKLLESSGYAQRPGEFRSLLAILESEVRLIAPTEPEGTATDSDTGEISVGAKYYQLTHDFLVPVLRDWLTRKQSETRQGRAALLLETLTAEWTTRPDHRRLPTGMEWISLRLLTRPRDWTSAQRRMMGAADRRHAMRLMATVAGVLCLAGGLVAIKREFDHRRRDDRVRALVSQLLTADVSSVASLLAELEGPDRSLAVDLARRAAASPESTAQERFRAELLLAETDPGVHESLTGRLLKAPPEEHALITARLANRATDLVGTLWRVVGDDARGREVQLRAACALARLDPDNPEWPRGGPAVAAALVHCEQRDDVQKWIQRLVPVGPSLVPWLSQRFREPRTVASERIIAGSALVDFIRSPVDLADLALDSSGDAFPTVLEALKRDRPEALAALRRFVASEERGGSDREQEHAAHRRAVAAIALLRLGADGDCWSLLREDDDPDFRTALVDRCAAFGVDPRMVLARLDREDDPALRAILLQALAEYLPDAIAELHARIAATCRTFHRQDRHAGVHFAAEWVLALLGQPGAEPGRGDDAAPVDNSQAPTAGWQATPGGISMVVIRSPQDFVIGSPDSELQREANLEIQRRVRLSHSFAISAFEITEEQFHQLVPKEKVAHADAVSKSPQCPMSNLTWLDAVKYCRLLSEAERIPESQMCYPPVDLISLDMKLPADCLERTGYRLPTDSEWECACRAGTRTARFFGRSPARLTAYGRYIANSGEHLWPVGSLRPNPWGLFDVYGNVLEWCHDKGEEAHPLPDSPDPNPKTQLLRSGTYRSVERENRSAKRYHYPPNARFAFLGMRIARTVAE